MDGRVRDTLVVVLLLNILIIGLSCGDRVVVIGGGSDGSGPIPTTDLGPSSLPSPRDPSQYEPPNLPALHNSGSPNSSTSSTIIGTNQSVTRTLEFSMTSRVVGSSTNSPGRSEGFSEWKCLSSDEGFKAKQASSALYGNLDETRIIKFDRDQGADDIESKAYAVLLSQEQIRFLGNSYNDRVSYLNKGDIIRNSFTGGATSKNSTYIGAFDDYSTSDMNETGHFRKNTMYNLDSRNVGITNLDLIAGSEVNSTEISEQYSGEIALRLNFKNNFNRTYMRDQDDWLPCCQGDLASTQEEGREYGNIANIPDCICGNLSMKSTTPPLKG